MKILLGVTGGIAAYKSAELCRLLVKGGAQVRVVMSEAACRFITPLTLETLSGHKVSVQMFAGEDPLEHINMPMEADLLLVAPATADYLARCAAGRASDLISALSLVHQGPVIAAPAMNTNMWLNPATRRNVELLKREHGWTIVDPGEGELACKTVGPGRMAELEEIVSCVEATFKRDLAKKKILVTAGPTVEDLDPVRFISNRSSGKTGYSIAAKASLRGAKVTLVSGPTSIAPPQGVELLEVRSALEMERAVMERAKGSDCVVMCAAVADFRPANYSENKIKKGEAQEAYAIDLTRNPDILANLGREFKDGGGPVVVGFALESESLLENAKAKLERKGAHILVANLAADALEGAQTKAVIMDAKGGRLATGKVSKGELADMVLDAYLGYTASI